MAATVSTTANGSARVKSDHEETRLQVGYMARNRADADVYRLLGFKCGLEIHQQLLTDQKLFCRCPAGLYQKAGDYDAELVRHMRPTLSELGEYDGTALMEFRTRKNIIYRLKNETACTYDIDDTPPFPINRQALEIAIRIALMLKSKIVGELHITRKQYLDGSIPTGFQRTAIVGIEGEIPLEKKQVRMIQLSIEEDSCREVSDIGHVRTYTTDRLGMPLIEMVTHPDMTTPDEAFEAGQYLRYLARSSSEVRTGIGAARQDVNVSITGGTRVEIKGVAHIKWIPELTHNEAFRQKALLLISELLSKRISKADDWKISHTRLNHAEIGLNPNDLRVDDKLLIGANLPKFKSALSFFTNPGRCFADEISDRLKVVACLDRPNMTCSEEIESTLSDDTWAKVRAKLSSGVDDAQILFWADEDDLETALITIEERCQLAFAGVPNETRKAISDGTTIFERVLPGPDRMYPDTDSAPIPIDQETIDRLGQNIASEVVLQQRKLKSWKIPIGYHDYLLRHNRVDFLAQIISECDLPPVFAASLLAQNLKSVEGRFPGWPFLPEMDLLALIRGTCARGLERGILTELIAVWYRNPEEDIDQLLTRLGYKSASELKITSTIPPLVAQFTDINTSLRPDAVNSWIMGQLRFVALGNIPLSRLRKLVDKELANE
ncbi:MAG: Glu-tRNA(Gln) amidotransferase subunit GatE [candidate division Zixibacteria bacterium]